MRELAPVVVGGDATLYGGYTGEQVRVLAFRTGRLQADTPSGLQEPNATLEAILRSRCRKRRESRTRRTRGIASRCIAARFGFGSDELWNAPENSSLKELRKNPNVLAPGDVVHFPAPKDRKVSLATGATHTLEINVPVVRLRLKLMQNGAPLAQEPYELTVSESDVRKGITSDEGFLQETIPPDVTSVTCVLTATGRRLVLAIGSLDPSTELSGVQARLRGIGAFGGAFDGAPSDGLTAALRAFQNAMGLDPSGTADEATRRALERSFGC